VVSSHKADLNLSHLYSLGSFLESFVEVWLGSVDNGPPHLVVHHQVLNSGHFDGYHHKNHISKFVELGELDVFSVVHLADIAEEVGLSTLLRSQFVSSRIYFELELHFECPTPLYLFFELELYLDDFDNHWLLWSQ